MADADAWNTDEGGSAGDKKKVCKFKLSRGIMAKIIVALDYTNPIRCT